MRRWGLLCGLVLALVVGWDTLGFGQSHYQGCYVNGANGNGLVACRVGGGTLYSLTINTKAAGGNGYLYIFDAAGYTSLAGLGSPIMSLDTTSIGPVTIVYNILVTKGVIVWNTGTGGTTAAADVTLSVE